MTKTEHDLTHALRQSLLKIQDLKQTLRAAESVSSQPIAIVGMSCRAPGGLASPESYWSLLERGGDGVGPLPRRWSRELLRRLEVTTGGLAQEGGFLDAVEEFDAGFFGISPREALEMDPQQRLVLEAVWEALERAGIRPEALSGSRTGTYLGSTGSDYGMRSLETMTMWTATGTLSSVLAGRVSYVLGLEGPAMTVDTACSSSLTALHLACAALRQGECDLALAGGVQVMSTPSVLVAMGPEDGMAPDGRCKSFSDGADGAGWSEGCGVLVLKRQSDAVRDGDEILALIRGSAVNQDGRSQGLTAPNGPSQQRVIRAALSASGLGPDDIDVVEAHGTGTRLGDPIEAGALASVFGPTRGEARPLWLGSSKSNLGHTQAAAGVLGVMKMVLALRHEVLPKTLHAGTPSRHIAWQGSGLSLLQEARPWRREALRVRRAGVSSFGISGTNAHVVLEEASARQDVSTGEEAAAGLPMPMPIPLLVSGRDAAALRAQAVRYGEWLAGHPEADWSGVVGTAALHRTQFGSRASVSARDASEAVDALRALGEGRAHAMVSVGEARDRGRVVFVFPGQGSQWPSMGRTLLAESAVFAEAIAACEAALSRYTDWSLTAVLRGDGSVGGGAGVEASLLERVDVIQPALFAMNVGLAAVWRSFGLEPSAVVGHSQGEIAAAVVAGILTLEEGARVVALRSRLLRGLGGGGGMAVTELAAAVVEERLQAAEWSGLSLAVVNTAGSTVVSGTNEAIERWMNRLGAEGVFCRRIDVDYASHSAGMDPILPELERLLSELSPQAGRVAMVSTVTGARCEGASLDGGYWCRNLRQPVRLDLALAELMGDGHGVFVEVSSHPVLAMALTAAGGEGDGAGVVVGSLRRDAGGLSELLRNLAVLHVHGVAVDWERVLGAGAGQAANRHVVSLPTYAFQRQRYWLEAAKAGGDAATIGQSPVTHPLLGAATPWADSERLLLTGRLSAAEPGWLADHAVFGTVLVPGTGLLELGFAAARAVGSATVSQLTLMAPLLLPREQEGQGGEEAALRVQVQVQVDAPEAGDAGRRGLSIYSRVEAASDASPWTLQAQGVLGLAPEAGTAAADADAAGESGLEAWPPAGGISIELGGFYAGLQARGYGYGPSFQGLREAWRVGDEVYGRAVLPEALSDSADAYGLHPALLDAALHVLGLAAGGEAGVLGGDGAGNSNGNGNGDGNNSDGQVLLPFEWSEVTLLAGGARELRVRASVERRGDGEALARLRLADGQGRVVARIGGLRLRQANEAQIRQASQGEAQHLYRLEWRPVGLGATGPDALAGLLLVGGDGALAARLGLEHVDGMAALVARLDGGGALPGRIVFDHLAGPAEHEGALPAATHAAAERGLAELQGILGDARLNDIAMVWLTRGAVSTGPEEGVSGLSRAPLWGLVRSARSEHPDRRLRLVDVDALPIEAAVLARLLSTASEPELALRHGAAVAPRLVRADGTSELRPPVGAEDYRVAVTDPGRLDGVSLVAAPELSEPLQPGQIRVSVRAAGMNFRDVLITLGQIESPGIGFEFAGVVEAVSTDVTSVSVGDRVFGFGLGCFGTRAVTPAQLVAKIPAGMSFEAAATVPLAYLTALYALQDLGQVQSGERVLVHAAAGGVGMAAVQLCRHFGAEVYGTASAGKWSVLKGMGLDARHIANSRDLSFETQFLLATDGKGVDVVLNSLTGEFVDASLRLLPRGGRFLEMGIADVRGPGSIAERYRGVSYQAFVLGELMEKAPERLQVLLKQLMGLFEEGLLQGLPYVAYDVRQLPAALRQMAQGRHVGKQILQLPRRLEACGTVLITGGVGELGAALARHLVDRHGVRHLLLTSRRGLATPGAAELVAELRALGAQTVQVESCDVSDRDAVGAVVGGIAADRPLTAVFHLAGALDDGIVPELTDERLARVLRPKLDGAWHLHEMTAGLDLAAFVLFSSVAGLGSPGQANYAAANLFLDGLAAERRHRGLAGQSLMWGFWEQRGTGMTAHLGRAELLRMRRQGVQPLSHALGLALLDAARSLPDAVVMPVRLDLGVLQRQFGEDVPALYRGLLRSGLKRASAASADSDGLRGRLAALAGERERLQALVALAQEDIAAVLGLPGAASVPAEVPLKELGLDSLMAVELRNRLSGRVGTKLPTTLAFDYPTARAMAQLLLEKLELGFSSVRLEQRRTRDAASSSEAIAIVGMSCRAPGGLASPESYWSLLERGGDGVGPLPRRWSRELLRRLEVTTGGLAQEGGFLDAVEEFDAGFFGISPREALEMDPQQRLVLEAVWEALERAGIRPEALSGSRTGTYLGSTGSDYGMRSLETMTMWTATGTLSSVLAGRVSYVLGLEGPAMTVDTACSSSLTALHLACAALRQGECDLALAGGVQVMSTPSVLVAMGPEDGMAPDGRCKSFSDGADGAGWSEGCGVLVLKRQSDAVRDGDEILALIRGSAVNQDGRSQGLTAPNGPSQQRVIRAALSASGLGPDDIDVVEAHGTGTRLGDPIEAGALASVFGPTRGEARPLWLGSSKSNLGHTQAAAGVLGVMKMVLALRHEVLPKTLHAGTPSRHIAWQGSGLSLLQEARPWRREALRVRRAGVSSFGISGTNAHVVLEEAPARQDVTAIGEEAAAGLPMPMPMPIPLLVSGRDVAALRAQAVRYGEWLTGHPEVDWSGVVGTAALHRTQFASRASVSARDASEAVDALRALGEGRAHAMVSVGEANGEHGGKLAFLFAGQGSQQPDMGRALLESCAAFREAFEEVCGHFDKWLEMPLGAVLFAEEGSEAAAKLDETAYAQPALFAIEVALFRQLEQWGVEPDILLGHSIGELAAAHVAGVWSLSDACRVVAVRGRLMQALPAGGAMVALEAGEAEVLPLLGDGVEIAGLNGPRSTVISGDEAAVLALAEQFRCKGRRTSRLQVSHAFHSQRMEPMLDEFRKVVSSVSYGPPQLPIVSNVTGRLATSEELCSAEYWVRQVRSPVRFLDGVRVLEAAGAGASLELGPDGVLTALAAGCLPEASRMQVVAAQRRGRNGSEALLAALGVLHVHGVAVDWERVLGAGAGRQKVVSLPTYAFQRQRYWLEAAKAGGDAATMGQSPVTHPLLGAATPWADSERLLLTGRLSAAEPGWLTDYAVFGTVLVPGTGLLELGFAAARAVGSATVSQLTLVAPLLLPREQEGQGGQGEPEGSIRVQVQVQVDAPEAGDAGCRGLSIYSRVEAASEASPWTLQAQGVLGVAAEAATAADAEAAEESGLEAWPPAGGISIELGGFYAGLQARGYGYGPSFQGLREAWRVGDEVYGRAVLPEALSDSADAYGLHPALLDAALHVLGLVAGGGAGGGDGAGNSNGDGNGSNGDGQVLLPFEWSEVTLVAGGARELRVRASVERRGDGEALARLRLADGQGRVVAQIGGLRLRQANEAQIRQASQGEAQHLYRLEWRPVGLGATGPDLGAAGPDALAGLLLVGGDGALAARLGLEHVDGMAALVARLDGGGALPGRIVFDHLAGPAETAGALLAATHAAAERGLAELQGILDDARLNDIAMVWLTCGAVSTGPEEGVSGLSRAPLWGLVRSARSEHPDRRLRLVDVDALPIEAAVLARLLSTASEPELALRHGAAVAPRLVRAGSGTGGPAGEQQLPRRLEACGTVLITGGTGELGAALGRHLVDRHGVRHLLLTSRRGLATPGAAELVAELRALGAQTVQVESCDVSDRDAVGAVVGGIAADRPLTGLFHLAATLDDGIVPELTGERLARVLRPKLDGAWHLHEVTAGLDLAAFVLFSSVAGLGSPGQANYAAANLFLDGLAAERRHRGLAGQSLMWGFWEQRGTGMTAHLGRAELLRMRRQGVQPLSHALGLALLDAARSLPDAVVMPVRLDLAVLQRQFGEDVPALYRGLLRSGLKRASAASADSDGLRGRLAALAGERERLQALVALAQEDIAAVLGLPGAASVPAEVPLKELGLDSLMAVELRNRLSGRVGTKLPTTLAFDYPTARAMAQLLLEKLELGFSSVRLEQRRTRDAASSASEAIAIVGMSCRAPGGLASPESYWSLLERGGDGVGPLPRRWSRELLRRLEVTTGGLAQEGGFLDAVEEFDAGFFGISPREALEMDPQQRLVLEAVWEALERAGIRPEGLRESRTGVYLGSMGSDYGTRSVEAVTMWTATGMTSSVLAGRVSYVLGLEGPAMTVDTACSSSLTALHLACTALRQGECDLALTGGVQVMSTPMTLVAMGNGMAPDGRCKSFSDGADGAGWSEGCGVLVLKRRSDAVRDGDEILALIRGSAVNQDGRSQGLTAPNGPSQQRVIRAALSASGLGPDDIDVVEAHGTGTRLGDPIEAGALASVFGPTRGEARPLWLGSSKSNLGHTQAAAGVLGVMKMVLALRHEMLPKTLHAGTPSRHIAWQGSGLSLLQEARPWRREALRVRRAGVSSFGISGTNAHVVLEEAPARQDVTAIGEEAAAGLPMPMPMPIPLLVSGRDAAALRAQAVRYGEWLAGHPEADWSGVVGTAALHRTQFGSRASVSARDASEAVDALRALGEGRAHAMVSVGEANGEHGGKLAFLFAGQGSQQPGMGRALLQSCSAFREAFEEVCGHFDKWLEMPLGAVLFAEEGSEAAAKLDETAYAQPALFAIEVALFRQLEQWGVEPDILLGHSIGELAAAHVAGVWSLSDACRVVAVRGRLMQALPAGGAMVALEAGEAEVLPLLGDGVEIAGLNGPRSTVISGDEAAVLALAEQFRCKGRRTSRLQVSHAFHSQRMEPMLDEFRKVVSSVSYGPPQLPIVSNVTGRLATSEELCSAEYWVRQVRSPVRFLDGVRVLEAAGAGASLELGPDGVLTALAAGCLPEASRMQVVAAQRRGRNGSEALLAALGVLHVHGVAVDWERVLGAGAGRQKVVSLPTYAFQRQRYWLEAAKAGGDAATMGQSPVTHPLLGAATPWADSERLLLTGRLSAAEPGWLADHAVFGTVLVPGTGLLELGFAAARAVGSATVSQLTLVAPLLLPREQEGQGGQGEPEGSIRVQVQVQVDAPEAGDAGRRGLSIYSRVEAASDASPWTLQAQGVLGLAPEAATAADADAAGESGLEAWPPAGGISIELAGFYAGLQARGYGYGPSFQGLREAWRVGDEVYGRAVLPEALSDSADAYGLHPALLDAALHVLGLVAGGEAGVIGGDGAGNSNGNSGGQVLLPFEWSEVTLLASGARELRVRASVERRGDGEALARLRLADGQGRVVAQIGGLRLRQANEAQIRQASQGEAQHLYRLEWRPVGLGATGPDLGAAGPDALAGLLLVGGDGALAARLGLEHVDGMAALVARLDGGGALPGRIVFDHLAGPAETAGALLAATHAAAERGLAELQGILDDARLNDIAMVWLTCGAVSTGPEEGVSGLSRAPLWGLVRSARSEHPDRRLRLVDVDALPIEAAVLARLLSTASEPELALRHGAAVAPRLVRAGSGTGGPAAEQVVPLPRRLEACGTVLITGGTGELGAALARHLVDRHGVRHLLLTSRRGLATPGAAELVAELRALGAQTVQVESCDVSDRDAVGAVVGGIAADRPLTAVFHLAGALDDGIVPELTGERLARVLRPKLDGAWHLHEVTAGLDLAAFVLFSSVAGLGSPGQANYAAANLFLDGLAAERRHRGLAGQSLMWGFWEQRGTGMTAHLGRAELLRMRRQGVQPLSHALGLALLDAARSLPDAVVMPVRLDLAVLQRQFGEDVPALYRGLLRSGLKRASAASPDSDGLRGRLAALAGERERLQALVALAQEDIAAVLGLPGAASVPAEVPLKELGLDSLMAVELRNRLSGRVGTKLPTTLAFDYPTARAMAQLLLEKLELGFSSVRLEQQRTRDAASSASEAIAIVGMSCRAPGGLASPESYWSLLERGGDGVGPLPRRWSRELLRRLEVTTGGLAQEGGFLDAVEEFDAGFFGISPREALEMDPQQRLVLEAVWEALERAGIRPEGLRESRTGVYLGSMGSDYGTRSVEAVTMWTATGMTSSVLAGRVSYVLGLEGPAMTVDTACSSSLTALHLACTALRQGECDLALAGGVQVMSTPMTLVAMGNGMAPDGRCKSFSDGADGAGWSEGCGVLVLKRQSDAVRDGDEILALIRGSAVNQDGRSQGLTAPNGPSQQRVIRAALSASGLGPDDIDVVEAHGTGTRLGDPIEAGALASVFGPTRGEARPLWLGSSKSNLGHTQAAAGVLGVMKMVLALRHEMLPKTLHAGTPSRHIAWQGSGLSLLQEARPWRREALRVRRAGVSSFGISGTNAHVVLEEASARQDVSTGEEAAAGLPMPMPIPLLVSGRDAAALRAQAVRYGEWLAGHPEADWSGVVGTAALHRTQFGSRASVSARDASEAVDALRALGEGRAHAMVSVGEARDRGRVVFVFPGQGSQWPSMGRTLLAESAVFAEAIAACEAALSRYTDWSLTAVLRGDGSVGGGAGVEASLLERVDVIQPALFAMNVGLAAVWRSFGLEPSAVVGHSQGEIAAAVVAGILTLEEGARVVALRSRLLRGLGGGGGMAVTELAAAVVEERLQAAEWSGLSLAVVNTAGSTVVSGTNEAIERWMNRLGAEGVFCRRVDVDYASHSAGMDPILPELERLLSELSPQAGRVAMVSTVTGARCEGASLDGGYWCRNLRQPVRLDLALAELMGDGHGVFVEVSSHPVLAMALTAAGGEGDGAGVVVGSLRREAGGLLELLRNLAVLHVHGVAVDWERVLGAGAGQAANRHVVSLPTYAFQRQRYWLEVAKAGGDAATMGQSPVTHPLLGAATPWADSERLLLTGRLSAAEPGWLADHAVFGTVLVPGTGLLELGFAAARAVGSATVSQLTLMAPLLLPREQEGQGGEEAALRVQVQVQVQVDAPEAGDAGRRGLSIYSRVEAASDASPWTLQAQGVLGLAPEAGTAAADADAAGESGLEAWPPAGGISIELGGFYAGLQARGYGYGPSFQGLREAWRVGDEVYGRAVLPEALSDSADAYGLHPALLDAALHVLGLAAGGEAGVLGGDGAGNSNGNGNGDGNNSDGQVLLPFEWSEVTLLAGGARELRVRASVERRGDGEALARLRLADGQGRVVARIGGLRLRQANEAQIRQASQGEAQHLYRLEWRPVGLGATGPDLGAAGPDALAGLLLVGGDGALAARLGLEHVDGMAALVARLDGGGALPGRIVFDHLAGPAETAGALLAATHAAAERGLAELQGILDDARLNDIAMVWLTCGAVSTGPEEGVSGLSRAPLWGLVRSARSEHPDRRLRLVDVDALPIEAAVLARLLSTASEPELALRHGAAVAPRLVRAGSGTGGPAAEQVVPLPRRLEACGTVLITGGTGELGAALARHLVDRHGVRHLLLTSRRGLATPGAAELVAELRALGAQTVQVESCDVSDRDAVGAVVGGIAADRPLTAVFHLAGALDDGIVPELTGERLARVLRPKLDGAWHLHEVTAGLDLAAFVLFSSVAGLGSPGQANYAAANLFLDGLAAERRHRGLAGQSLMWGFWEQRGTGMTAHLGRAELLRMRRQGVQPLSHALGLALLDAARSLPDAVVMPVRLDLAVLQRQFGEDVPALYRGLLRSGLKRASAASADSDGLRGRLAALAGERERLQALVALAQEDIAAVLGLPGAASVPAEVPLKELGLDSLMAVALRNRLSGRIGTKLPTTLAFDYPTARAMAQLLLEKLSLNERAIGKQGTAGGAPTISKTEWLRSVEMLLRSADPEFLRQLDLERRLSGLAEMSALLEESDSSCVVPIRPGVGNRVMFYIPGLGHGATRGNTPPVITQLSGDYPITGLSPYPLAAQGLLSGSIASLASGYLPHVESWIGDRSVFFVGSSFGGLVAMALASELERRGRHVAGVVLLDTLTPGTGILPLPIEALQDMACAYLTSLYGLTEQEGEKLAELTGAPSVPALREMIGDNYQCHKDWTLPVLAAPVHLLHAKEFVATPGLSLEQHALLDLGWSRFGLELASVAMVPGNHTSMYTHPEMPGHIDALFELALLDGPPAPDVGRETADRSDRLYQ